METCLKWKRLPKLSHVFQSYVSINSYIPMSLLQCLSFGPLHTIFPYEICFVSKSLRCKDESPAPSLPFVDVRPPLGKWCQLQSSWTSQTSLCYLGWQWAKWGLMVDGCTRNMFYMFFQRSMIDGRFRWTSCLFSRQGLSIGWCRKLSMTGINTSGFWDVYIFLDVPYLLLEYFFRYPSSSRLPAQQHHSWGGSHL